MPGGKRLTLYVDGASSGNPGPAGGAYAIFDESGERLELKGRHLGVRTNNEAEYEALLLGLAAARRLRCADLLAYSDSEVMVRQLNGLYQVKKMSLQERFDRVKALAAAFESFRIRHVGREDPNIEVVDDLAKRMRRKPG